MILFNGTNPKVTIGFICSSSTMSKQNQIYWIYNIGFAGGENCIVDKEELEREKRILTHY